MGKHNVTPPVDPTGIVSGRIQCTKPNKANGPKGKD